jgi:predicted house-cleaning noncanonical NTP pyrophosphatase (MazG superfamily)
MKPTFVKKNTAGGAAGLSWEAGEVKALNSLLADELTSLVPEDYEIVQEDEYTPELTESTLVEEVDDESTEENAEDSTESEELSSETVEDEKPSKPRAARSRKNTETPSAE